MLRLHQIENDKDREAAFRIRREVFIIGQNVPEEIEMDEFDDVATHVLAQVDHEPAGTARWRMTGEGYKLERFAVLEKYRGCGVGLALVDFIIDKIADDRPVYLNAQTDVISFYEQKGFVAEGDIFYEADIPHRRMVLNKS